MSLGRAHSRSRRGARSCMSFHADNYNMLTGHPSPKEGSRSSDVLYSLIILRSIRQAVKPDPESEKSWWNAAIPDITSVDCIYTFVPDTDSKNPLDPYSIRGLHLTATHLLEEIQ